MIKEAITSLQQGSLIILFDEEKRENECDFFLAAELCTPAHIRTLRQEGGGVIFLTITPEIGKRFGLHLLSTLYAELAHTHPVLDALHEGGLKYDKRSAFSISINHRETYTGVTDNDRSFTVKKFAELCKETENNDQHISIQKLGSSFRSPGHIPICLSASGMLKERKGHTELISTLSQHAALSGVCVGCEIMGDDGSAKSRNEVERYAREKGIPFIDSSTILKLQEGTIRNFSSASSSNPPLLASS